VAWVQLQAAALVAEGRIRLAEGTLIRCANYVGSASKSELPAARRLRRLPFKSLFVWRMRLVL
jgi:hypothetical protein